MSEDLPLYTFIYLFTEDEIRQKKFMYFKELMLYC